MKDDKEESKVNMKAAQQTERVTSGVDENMNERLEEQEENINAGLEQPKDKMHVRLNEPD